MPRWHRPGAVQRAFQLAESGNCSGIEDIHRRLEIEQYADVFEHLSGPLIRQQLRQRMREVYRIVEQGEGQDRRLIAFLTGKLSC